MYRSFLLRVWHQLDGRARASVEEVDTGAVERFDELEQLYAWLEDLVDDAGPDHELRRQHRRSDAGEPTRRQS